MPGDHYTPPSYQELRSGENYIFNFLSPPGFCHFLTPGLFTFNTGPVSSELADLHHVTPRLSNPRHKVAVGFLIFSFINKN